MAQERIIVGERSSTQGELGGLIVSARKTYPDAVEFVVGRPGLPNIETRLGVGGAVLFETPDEGIFEVRVLATGMSKTTFLISQVSPHSGIAGGLADQDLSNSSFTASELVRIADSLQSIRIEMSERTDVTPEQLDLISRKLDELQASSQRLGRKDWMNLAIGTLTSIIVNAALGPDIGKALFRAAGAALSWLLGNTLKLLS